MMTISRIIETSLKCGLLASFLLVLLVSVFEKNIGDEFILVFFFSSLITCIISFCMIIFTILPFTLFIEDNSTVFKKVFPFYSIIFFLGVVILSIISNFNEEMFYITIPAFFTAMMGWIWLFKNEVESNNTENS